MSKNKTVRNVFFTIFCLFACISLSYGESCSTAGATQNKYTASGCSYTTQSRTCCATTGEWSDWGGSCPSCSSSQCWDGSKCADKEAVSRTCSGNVTNAQSGTQTRTATCTNGSGWSYGAWTGTCTCKSGYTWSGFSCNRDNPPSITVFGCQAVPGNGGDDSHTWVGGHPTSAPSSDMYAVIAVTGYFSDTKGNTYTNYDRITLNFQAGEISQVSKEFDLGMPDGCDDSSICSQNPYKECNFCSYSSCTATLHSSGWQ